VISRREALARMGMGMGWVGLAPMLASPLAPRGSHFPARAKRVVHLFMNGGPSQVDTFDLKPSLAKYAGRAIPIHLRTERRTGAAFPSPFNFRRCGESGTEVSEIFPLVGDCADELCVIRSMHTNIPNHGPSLMMMNCGTERQVRPSFGSWVTYGLGTENQNLPGFVVLCPGGLPTAGSQNWRSAFLPGAYQATHVDTKEAEVDRLIDNVKSHTTSRGDQRAQLDLLAEMNAAHRASRPGDELLDARVASFELAFRMQMEATDVFDLGREPAVIRDMYGDTPYGRQMLIARRLIERGVRVVQVWHGAGQPWDSHSDIRRNHARLAAECDRPIAAFLRDLRQRGMLDDTLVVWGGEFGRTPTVELTAFGSNQGVNGRDHNSYGFSMWIAGGGARRGHVHGATDEFGFRAEEKRVHVHDLHATLLHLLGFDHERLTFRMAGRDFRLTDVHGSVVPELLA
jgi:hypothetical protein